MVISGTLCLAGNYSVFVFVGYNSRSYNKVICMSSFFHMEVSKTKDPELENTDCAPIMSGPVRIYQDSCACLYSQSAIVPPTESLKSI